MTVDMPCDCTHPKSEHAGLAYACWGNCGCKRYTPDIQAAAITVRINPEPQPEAAPSSDYAAGNWAASNTEREKERRRD